MKVPASSNGIQEIGRVVLVILREVLYSSGEGRLAPSCCGVTLENASPKKINESCLKLEAASH